MITTVASVVVGVRRGRRLGQREEGEGIYLDQSQLKFSSVSSHRMS